MFGENIAKALVCMAIFLAKYAYAVLRAFDAGAVSSPLFVIALSGAYGLLSGYFAARALNLVAVVLATGAPDGSPAAQ